jgi:hypothetical protein
VQSGDRQDMDGSGDKKIVLLILVELFAGAQQHGGG